jgi:hypothetical protein
MKKLIIIIFMTVSLYLSAQDIGDNINGIDNNEIEENNSIDYDKTGLIISISAFNYFSTGIGFNKGKWFRAGPHFAGYNYGAIVEYKTIDELHLRFYGNMYGGVSAIYIGTSAVLSTNFEEFTGGLAPEIGLGFPGFGVFYRYNFYFYKWDKYNCHEIVLLIYPLNKLFCTN